MNIGIQQSATAQEARCPGWADHASELLRKYARKRGGSFDIEDFREYAAVCGLPEPANACAYGNVFMRAERAGLIRFVGARNATRPEARGRLIRLWRAA